MLPILMAACATLALLTGPVPTLPAPPAWPAAPLQEAADGTTTDGTTTDGAELLAEMTAFYAGLPAWSVTVETRMEVPGMPDFGGGMTHELSVRQPDGLAMRQVDGQPAGSFVVNGEQYYQALDAMRRYVVEEGPGTLAEGLHRGRLMAPTIPSSLLLPMVLGDAEAPGSLAASDHVELLAETELDGRPCHQLNVGDAGAGLHIWIATGDEPWLLRVRPLPPDLPPDAPDGAFMVELDFHLRDSRASVRDGEEFSVEAPAGFTKADTLFPDMPMPGGGGEAKEPRAAPAASMPLLDGGSVELASLQGKVVVLAFWATWCKPCIAELPILIKLADEFADRGLVLYAVNMGESEDTARKGMERYELDMTVVTDPRSELARTFGVQPIPHTTLIDRQGQIRHEHTGFGPGIERTLRRELEALLDEPPPEDT